ncbi:MAG: Gfo/Idh/MocA family oxidoreductase [Planctomycetaceae bacterium]|nr:Gfo/Idh/MocA family oxidoreductase [Planctomycetaceae bacterium]
MNVGILGFAHGHVGAYCGQWKNNPQMGITVTAGWDHDPARATGAGETFAIKICGTPQDLLARGDVDAVVIAAETNRHAELVELAAAAGKSIVLQKPMALTLDEADRIVAAVDAHAVAFTLAWQMRVDAENLKMKAMVDSGVLGRICMVRRRHGLATHTWGGFENSWHADPAANRDIWADDSSHAIDFIYWLLGMPASVTAELATLINPKVPNDNGIAVFRYAGGPLAEVGCSFTCVAGENTTEIVGEKGVIVQNFGDGPSANNPRPAGAISLKWFLQDSGQWTVSDVPGCDNQGVRIAALAAPLAEFLQGRRGPIATAAEGRDVLRIVLATYESSCTGRRVAL